MNQIFFPVTLIRSSLLLLALWVVLTVQPSVAQTVYSENFNSLTSTTSVPSGWVLVNMDGRAGNTNVSTLTGNSTNAWTFPTVFTALGRSAVSVSWTAPVGVVDRWMISPTVSIPATGTYYLIYEAQSLGNSTYPEAYELRISNGDTARSSFLTSPPMFSTTGENTSLTMRGFSLAAYAGQTIRMAFRNISNDMVAMLVDNIQVTVPASERALVIGHSVPNLAFTNNPVTLGGTFRNAGLSPITSANLKYQVNNNAVVSEPYAGSVTSFNTETFVFATNFTPSTAGTYSIKIWLSDLNGGSTNSDTLTTTLSVVDPAPPVQSNLVIYEHFTNASCGPCAAYNPAFQALLLANNMEVTSVKHHTSWPGTDPMYSFNTTDPTSRVNYYGVTGVPAVRLGNMLSSNPANITQANLDDNILTLPNNWNYNLNTTVNGSTLSVTGSVTGKSTQSNTDNKLWLYLVEDPISYTTPPGSNGETEFPSVLRKILPTSSGINCGNGSLSTSVNANYPLSSTFVRDNLYLLAFVQANGTKEANKGVKIKIGNSINTTGTSELASGSLDLRAYPNPCNEQLTLAWKQHSAAASLTLTNSLGQVVFESKTSSEEDQKILNTMTWEQGLYLVKITDRSGRELEQKRVMVRH